MAKKVNVKSNERNNIMNMKKRLAYIKRRLEEIEVEKACILKEIAEIAVNKKPGLVVLGVPVVQVGESRIGWRKFTRNGNSYYQRLVPVIECAEEKNLHLIQPRQGSEK